MGRPRTSTRLLKLWYLGRLEEDLDHALFVGYVLVAAFDHTCLERVGAGRPFFALCTAFSSPVGSAFSTVNLFVLTGRSRTTEPYTLHDRSP